MAGCTAAQAGALGSAATAVVAGPTGLAAVRSGRKRRHRAARCGRDRNPRPPSRACRPDPVDGCWPHATMSEQPFIRCLPDAVRLADPDDRPSPAPSPLPPNQTAVSLPPIARSPMHFRPPPHPPLPLLSTTLWPYRQKDVRDVSSGPRGGAFVMTAPWFGCLRCVFVSSLEAAAQLPPVCRGHDRGAGQGGEWRGEGARATRAWTPRRLVVVRR